MEQLKSFDIWVNGPVIIYVWGGGGGGGGRGLKDFDSKINDKINLVPAKVLQFAYDPPPPSLHSQFSKVHSLYAVGED